MLIKDVPIGSRIRLKMGSDFYHNGSDPFIVGTLIKQDVIAWKAGEKTPDVKFPITNYTYQDFIQQGFVSGAFISGACEVLSKPNSKNLINQIDLKQVKIGDQISLPLASCKCCFDVYNSSGISEYGSLSATLLDFNKKDGYLLGWKDTDKRPSLANQYGYGSLISDKYPGYNYAHSFKPIFSRYLCTPIQTKIKENISHTGFLLSCLTLGALLSQLDKPNKIKTEKQINVSY